MSKFVLAGWNILNKRMFAYIQSMINNISLFIYFFQVANCTKKFGNTKQQLPRQQWIYTDFLINHELDLDEKYKQKQMELSAH